MSAELEDAVARLRERATELARLAPAAKAALLRQCITRLIDAAPAWVKDGTAAKGLPADAGEEWLAGPLPTARNALGSAIPAARKERRFMMELNSI